MGLFCLGISGLASFLSPFFNQLNGRLCLPRAPNVDQKGTQSHLLCTKNLHAGAPAKSQSRLQESRWQPVRLLRWESPGPCARKIRLKVWHPLVLCAFTGSYNPKLLVISHLGSLSTSVQRFSLKGFIQYMYTNLY